MAEFLGVGDLHLPDVAGSGGLSKYVQDPTSVVLGEVEKVLEYGRKKGVNKVFLYGDICESPRMSYESVLGLATFLSRNDDFEFFVILGNHDLYSEVPEGGHSLEILKLLYNKPNVRFILKPKTLNIDGSKVRFLPYPHSSFDRLALNVCHLEVKGSKNDAGKTFDSEDLPKSKAVILAGHLHTAHQVRNTYYSGTLYQCNFGESLPKYLHHIDFTSPEDYEIKLVKHNPTYKLHNIVLQTRNDLSLIPKSEFDLVKLVIQDGCDVSASDYSSHSNIVLVKNFKSKDDLAAVLTEDLTEGQEVVFEVADFFNAWVSSLDVEESMRSRIKEIRKRVLNTVKPK